MDKNTFTTCSYRDICNTDQEASNECFWVLLLVGNILALWGSQTFLWWLSSNSLCMGLTLNICIAILFWLPIILVTAFEDTALTNVALLFTVGTIGLYICISFYFSEWLIAGSLSLIIAGIIFGEKIKTDRYVLYGSAGFYMLYVCCSWGAMAFMGITPAAPVFYWSGLCILTLIAWFIPMLDFKMLRV